jgi:transcriptional regulator with XRE-family HTH domain
MAERNAPPARLQQLRTARGETLAQLATVVGRAEATVSRWETGHIGVPDAMKLKLAEHYGVTVADLMGWTDQVAA